MNVKVKKFGILLLGILFQGCDLMGESNDTAPLIPSDPPLVDPNILVPPADEAVITTDENFLYDVSGQQILLRGTGLNYGANPPENFKALDPIADTGANVIRVKIDKDTTLDALELALQKVVENRQAVILSFTGDNIACSSDDDSFYDAVENYWLDKFNPVIAQRRFQAHLMINIADRWGPENIFDPTSLSYSEYINNYKWAINKFRDAGFKVPLVIDAPGCGADTAVFDGGRGLTLNNFDSEKNVVLSAHATGVNWNSDRKLTSNLTGLAFSGVPYVISGFDGSGVNGDNSINHNALLAKSLGDKAIAMDIPWGALDDKFAYVYTPEVPFNLLSATVSVDVLLSRALVNDGNMNIDLYVKDSEYRFASLGTTSVSNLRENGWATISFTVNTIGDIRGYISEGFDPSSIIQLGWQVSANNKPTEVVGDIVFDNFRVDVGGAPEPVFEATFDADGAGFQRSWGAGAGDGEAPVNASGGELIIAPVWGASADDGDGGGGALTQLEVSNYNALAIDMAGPFTMSVDLFVPEEYASETLDFKFVLKDSNWTYGQINWVGDTDIVRGQYQTISVSISDLASEINYAGDGFVFSGAPNAFGFAVSGVTTEKSEAIKLDNFKVELPVAAVSNELYRATFDSDVNSFSRSWGAGAGDGETPFTQADGELLVLPIWGASADDGDGGGGALTKIEAANYNALAMNLSEGFSMSVDVFVPDEYAAETLEFKMYVKDAGWRYGQVLYVGNDQILRGQMQTFTAEISNLIEDASWLADGFVASGAPNAFGFEIGGVENAKTEAVRVDNFVVVGPEKSEQENIFHLVFDTQEQVDSIMFDFASGSLSQDALALSKVHVYGVLPFNWIANTWFEPEGERMVLSLVDAVGETAVLTERGEDIVNGENGIGATSFPIFFPDIVEIER